MAGGPGVLQKPKLLRFVLHLTVATYDVPLSPTGAKGHVGGALRRSSAEPRAYQVLSY